MKVEVIILHNTKSDTDEDDSNFITLWYLNLLKKLLLLRMLVFDTSNDDEDEFLETYNKILR